VATGLPNRGETLMSDAPILICFDGGDNARRAIDAAAALLGPKRAVVLTVAPRLTFAESAAATDAFVPGSGFEDLNQADRLPVAQEGAGYAREAGLSATERVEVAAETWEGIVNVAAELDSPVIVIGTRALSRVRGLVEKSVSEDVARHAGRPVLIVPPPYGQE
jgi:nucleotide-binding universal stress UspA family protein